MTIDRIKSHYARIKHRAWSAFRRGDHNTAFRELSRSAEVAYTFNWIYTDPDSEELIRQISHSLFGVRRSSPRGNRIVFYDSFGWDNRGLTQQYIRSLRDMGVEFLFVFERRNPQASKAIAADLEQCGDKVELFELDSTQSQTDRAGALLRKLEQYAPSKALLHLEPGSAMALAVFTALADVVKYNINLTDHAFWLGAECIDYNIEFRDYGQTVSVEKRGLRTEQLLQLPYYAIQNKTPFQGWPDVEIENPVRIFSGASYYKIYGREGKFFDLVLRILTENRSAVIYFAGWGKAAKINKFIKENGLERRFLLIGHRHDIDAVFQNCDIYLGTYPVTGGLMSQYASINNKPILAYNTTDLACNEIEGIVCHNRYEKITLHDQEEYHAYARRLCGDPDFRLAEGRRTGGGCVITPEQFAASLHRLLSTGKSHKPYTHVEVDYEKWTELYLEVENKFLKNCRRRFLRYRVVTALSAPLEWLRSIGAQFNVHTNTKPS